MLPEFNICEKVFSENGLSLEKDIYEKLDIYADFLVKTNEVINLTAITDPYEILVKHFADSIAVTRYVDFAPGVKVIDVGTGAGFPLLPIKIYKPEIEITLLDGNNKRINFLSELCNKLELNAECIHERAELLARNDNYRENYDIAVARAVSAMPALIEYCLPFVKKNGVFCAMKGPSENIAESENAVKLLGGKFTENTDYEINGEKRRIIIIKKIAPVSPKYPRASGKIKSKPL